MEFPCGNFSRHLYSLNRLGLLERLLHLLPSYAPDLNPDELVWSHAKRTGVARKPLMKGEKLQGRVHDQLQEIGNNPKLVRSFLSILL